MAALFYCHLPEAVIQYDELLSTSDKERQQVVFSSPIFLFVFLPTVFILYRLCRNLRVQNALLAFASLVFYAFGQLRYVPLFLLSVCVNYLAGLLLLSRRGRSKLILTLAVVLNLGILAVFKYTDFFLANLNHLLGFSHFKACPM